MSRKMTALQTTEAQIKAEINRMHKRGSSDWQSLGRQVNRHYKKLNYNRPQMLLMSLMPHLKIMMNIWGRATGKTTAMGGVVKTVWADMPRSINIIETSSFHKFYSEIIPSLRSGLEKHGLYENLHYFIGKKPPTSWNWDLPYQYPHVVDNTIFSCYGSAHVLVSQDAKGGGLGLNVDSVIRDEVKLLNPEKSFQQVNGTKRGSNVKAFEGKKTFMSEVGFTSAPTTQRESWILDYCEMLEKSNGLGMSLWATTLENQHNLAKNYLDEQRKLFIYQWLYDAEFFNILPKKVMDAFYALFSEDQHGYTNRDYHGFKGFDSTYEPSSLDDGDINHRQEIIFGIDYGGRGNFGVACQIVEGQRTEFRVLKDFFTLLENRETQRELARDFAHYYRHHMNKTVRIVCDSQGFHPTGIDIRTRVEILRDDLMTAGWHVQIEQIGMNNPPHHLRRTLWEMILKEADWWLPIFRINLENCRNSVISMQNCRSIENRKGEISKDKNSEKSTSGVRAEHSNHLTDSLDYPLWYFFSEMLEGRGISLPSIS
jgi:hypothetical protein